LKKWNTTDNSETTKGTLTNGLDMFYCRNGRTKSMALYWSTVPSPNGEESR